MEAHAKCVCGAGGDILNVGFGMGLVDTAIQGYSSITSHTIIEAHPDVYKRSLRLVGVRSPMSTLFLGERI
jgi:protein arginine N-methyltransferase 2